MKKPRFECASCGFKYSTAKELWGQEHLDYHREYAILRPWEKSFIERQKEKDL